MFFALVMFMSIIGAVFGQTPATLPYSCDFEAAGDNGWTLKNGTVPTNGMWVRSLPLPDTAVPCLSPQMEERQQTII